MRHLNHVSIVAYVFLAGAVSHAQQTPQFPSPQEEHKWLVQFVGQWDMVSEGPAELVEPGQTNEATMTARMIGPFWVVSEMEGDTPVGKFRAIQTIGYDAARQKYVGTWVDSMTNYLWHYEGTIDASGMKLTLEAKGPDIFTGEGVAKYRDSYEFISSDEFRTESSMLGEDGEWVTFMSGTATRKQ